MINKCLSIFLRLINIYRNNNNYVISISDGIHPFPELIVLPKNGLFQIAYLIRLTKGLEKEKCKSMLNINLKYILCDSKNESDLYQKLIIPNWAKSKLFSKIERLALEEGWNGEEPKINSIGPYR